MRLGRIPELRIPWHSLTPWLLNSPVEDVLAAILRMIALLMAWWLLASTLLYLVASLTRVPGAIRAVCWCTLPVIRTVTDHAVALTLATSLVGSGTGATIAAATPIVAAAPQRPGPVAGGEVRYTPTPAGAGGADVGLAGAEVVGYTPRAAGPPLARQQPEPGQPSGPVSSPFSTAPTSGAAAPSPFSTKPTSRPAVSSPFPTKRTPPAPPPPPPPPPEQRQEAEIHKVVEGDNLWTISRDRLAEATRPRVSKLSDHEIAAYWLRVIAANPPSSLRSGDPDLIFPGEEIRLPPISGS